jgi:oxalate decarboxylase/phosphoglucose isomerase-like protein (cupin superfamily)
MTQLASAEAGTFDPPSKEFPYQQFMDREDIPVYRSEIGIADVTALPRAPWARTAGNAAFLELKGTFQSERGVYIGDVPPRGQLKEIRHLYEEEIFVLKGVGAVEVWQGSGEHITLELGRGSVFTFPPNTNHALYNTSSADPLVYMAVNNAPRIINAVYDETIVFASDHQFVDIYATGDNYFLQPDKKTVFGWYKQGMLETRFIPDARVLALDAHEQKVVSGQLTGYQMGPRFPRGHISAWPSGIYHKAHYHGPGAVLLGLDGEGYVLAWPSSLGPRPYATGHGDEVARVEWGENSIYVPPNAYFHQHFNTGPGPARHIAVYGETLPLGVHSLAAESGWKGHLSYREGGTLIEYADEDPQVRGDYEAALAARGLKSTMPAVTYRD